jgi:hypothetical protein
VWAIIRQDIRLLPRCERQEAVITCFAGGDGGSTEAPVEEADRVGFVLENMDNRGVDIARRRSLRAAAQFPVQAGCRGSG